MPAKSRRQRKLMGWAYACKTGKSDNCPNNIQDIADSMSKKDLKKMASTEEDDLPKKVKKESLNNLKTFEEFNGVVEDDKDNTISDYINYIEDKLGNELSGIDRIRLKELEKYLEKEYFSKHVFSSYIRSILIDDDISDALKDELMNLKQYVRKYF